MYIICLSPFRDIFHIFIKLHSNLDNEDMSGVQLWQLINMNEIHTVARLTVGKMEINTSECNKPFSYYSKNLY